MGKAANKFNNIPIITANHAGVKCLSRCISKLQMSSCCHQYKLKKHTEHSLLMTSAAPSWHRAREPQVCPLSALRS